MTQAIIKAENGVLAFYSTYDATLVTLLKQMIPATGRQWDGRFKRWLVDPAYENQLETACNRAGFSVSKQGSLGAMVQPKKEQRIFRVDYIGAPREREDGSITASGSVNGQWSIVFPQDVLKAWFESGFTENEKPTNVTTFYGLLAIKRDVDQEAIKTAYRKMARRFHPDVNKDADAPEMMQKLNQAYEVLRNSATRRKYDAGLALEATLDSKPEKHTWQSNDWRPPIRCGFLLVNGYEKLGRFIVESIQQWQDIVNDAGLTMVTSWNMDTNSIEVNWI